MKYTPAGRALREFTLAFPHKGLEKDTVGYVDVIVEGKLAEESQEWMKIGKKVELVGRLWARTYKNRQGDKVTEVKVILQTLGGNA